jgi:hypothetical protein
MQAGHNVAQGSQATGDTLVPVELIAIVDANVWVAEGHNVMV